jgi:hypothetical protein
VGAFEALKIPYDKEVTGLRTAGLLIEIRTSGAARRYADSRKISKNDVARFRVQIPGVNVDVVNVLTPANQTTGTANKITGTKTPPVRTKRPVFSGYVGGRLRTVTAADRTRRVVPKATPPPVNPSFTSQQEQWLLMFQQFNITPLQKRILLVGMGDRENFSSGHLQSNRERPRYLLLGKPRLI